MPFQNNLPCLDKKFKAQANTCSKSLKIRLFTPGLQGLAAGADLSLIVSDKPVKDFMFVDMPIEEKIKHFCSIAKLEYGIGY